MSEQSVINPAETAAAVEPADFETMLKGLPEDVQSAYGEHIKGLKSALDKERAANKSKAKTPEVPEVKAVKPSTMAADLKSRIEAASKPKAADTGAPEKLLKQLDALKAERDQYAMEVRNTKARDLLLIVAGKAHIEFASEIAKQDALRFALEGAEVDDDGTVKDAEKILTAVVTDRPYLIKPIAQPTGTTNAAARSTGNGNAVDAAKVEEVKRRYRINR